MCSVCNRNQFLSSFIIELKSEQILGEGGVNFILCAFVKFGEKCSTELKHGKLVKVYQWVHDPHLFRVKSKYNYDVIDEWDVSLCHNRMVMFDGLSL